MEENSSYSKPNGLQRWMTTVDHKDIGYLYLVFGGFVGLWGATDAIMVRTELLTPTAGIWGVETYNALFTTHGLSMLFLFATPVAFGLSNHLVPLLVGADDMAFPRVNAVAFWLLPMALLLMRSGILANTLGIVAIRPPMTGWTFYPPLSIRELNLTIDLVLLGLHLSGVSTILSAINFIVTIMIQRDEDVGWERLDIFSWTILTTSGIVVFAFPILGAVLLMILLDRNVGTTFFTVEGGGYILYQHLFWFFGHPEVYILTLPAMGLISLILPKFTGRTLFGFKFVVYSTLAIGVLSFGVWGHHMFTTGVDPRIRSSFMAVTLAIALPSAVKVFNWIATLWDGRVQVTPPLLFCTGAIFNFNLGGITGVFLAALPVNLRYHGTYYVVGHFHFILVGMIVFALFGACYYWFPLLTGQHYDRNLAMAHFWLTMIGALVTFGILLLLGMQGLPRRSATYPLQFAPLQQLATVGAYVMGFGQILWLLNMVKSLRTGERITDADVWNLKQNGMFTREWQWFERRLR
ncbi:cbb3-type cytochrome c oxidase subunit I [Halalkalicoccus ordinarius]|uniref:cbb3-type cytochrome c oxidase subunit I n=1 Tax=Halalkalicoccus ordinarius TaxID=3116651 RepID=UPI00300EE1E6